MIYEMMKDAVFIKNDLKFRVNNEFLIVSSKKFNVFFFNYVAKDFYLMVDGEKTLEDIVNKLLENYKVERKTLIDDIVILIRDLQWKDLLRIK